jgi:long-chain fatty acid transport protein
MGAAFFTSTVHAGGFAVSDKSVSALGAGFAGQAALAEDASILYNNPAGMTQLGGSQLTVGAHRVATSARFHDQGSDTAGAGANSVEVEAWLPNFYYTHQVGPDLHAGFGLYAPFGLGLQYDDDWMGRYHIVRSDVRTLNLSPALAWRVSPALSVGGSIDAQYLDATMTKAIDFGTLCVGQQMAGGASQAAAVATCNAIGLQPQQDDGQNRMEGDNWAAGYSLGVTWADAQTHLGLAWHSGITHELKGASSFENVPAAFAGLFTDSSGRVKVNMPASASLSLAQAVSERLMLLADYTWTGWSTYKELRVQFDNSLPDSVTREDWHDAARYGLGAHFRVSPTWLLRAGFAYDETPVPDAEHRTPRLPDTDRRWVTVGARWDWQTDRSVDVSVARIQADKIPIHNTETTSQHTLNGTYDVSSTYVSAALNWRF